MTCVCEPWLPASATGRSIRGENSGLPSDRGHSPLRPQETSVTQATLKPNDTRSLDTLTGGAFSAPTSGERAARVREWLAANPSVEQMQEVFRELSGRDKGAAKLLREKLDEIKRSKGQEAIAAEWAEKARALLAQGKLNIADAMAWQRDAAKAGAPLSREPLASLKAQLADRDQGHRGPAAPRPGAARGRRACWPSASKCCPPSRGATRRRPPSALAARRSRLAGPGPGIAGRPELGQRRHQVPAFAGGFTRPAAGGLGGVPERAGPGGGRGRGCVRAAAAGAGMGRRTARRARRAGGSAGQAGQAQGRSRGARASHPGVREVLAKLEQEIAQGHGKASAGAAAALRNALKEHGKLIDDKLENQAHAALAAAGELEGWQRWRADQLRQELVAKAEALFEHPAPVEGQEPQPPKPRYGGRKMQEQLRALREQWKQTDQGGVPNHALVETLRRRLQRGPQGGGSLARQGQGRGGGTPGPAAGADRGSQGLGRGKPRRPRTATGRGSTASCTSSKAAGATPGT